MRIVECDCGVRMCRDNVSGAARLTCPACGRWEEWKGHIELAGPAPGICQCGGILFDTDPPFKGKWTSIRRLKCPKCHTSATYHSANASVPVAGPTLDDILGPDSETYNVTIKDPS